jgi:hypothetical protein
MRTTAATAAGAQRSEQQPAATSVMSTRRPTFEERGTTKIGDTV